MRPLPGTVGCAVLPDHLVHAVELGIDLVARDELPLLPERLEVGAGVPAVLLVHQQERVQPLELHPPFLLAVLGTPEGRAVAIEASQRLRSQPKASA